MTFLTSDVIMVVTSGAGIFFVSVVTGNCISHCQLKYSKPAYAATVLSDGRICVGGDAGYCTIFQSPEIVQDYIGEYSDRMYSSLFLNCSVLLPASPIFLPWRTGEVSPIRHGARCFKSPGIYF